MAFIKIPEGGATIKRKTDGATFFIAQGSYNPEIYDIVPTPPTPTPTPAQQTTPTLASIREGITKAQQTFQSIQASAAKLTPPPIQEPTPAQFGAGTPTIAPMKGSAEVDALTKSLQQDLENKRAELEKAYSQELERIRVQQTEKKATIEGLRAKEEEVLTGKVKPLLEPFREATERTERTRLKIEENFFENQKIVSELQTLLTQGQTAIEEAEAVTGLEAIRTPRINEIKQDVLARAGILEATMAARNNQITVAQRFIDRTVAAIEADRKDQLNYYQTVLNFYETERTEAGARLIELTKDEKEFVKSQINLIASDLERSRASVDAIKKLMVDPETAQVVKDAGVTLKDDVDTINKKMAEWAYQNNRNEMIKDMVEKGFKYLATQAQIELYPESQLLRVKDNRGNEMVFWKRPTEGETKSTLRQQEFDDAVAFVQQNKNAKPEEIENALRRDAEYLTDSDIKSIVSQGTQETAREFSDEQIMATVNFYAKPTKIKDVLTREEILRQMEANTKLTPADKARTKEIINQTITDEMNNLFKKIKDSPDKYKIKSDGIYRVHPFWPDSKVLSY